MNLFPMAMFPDVATLTPPATAQEDDDAGRVDVPGTPVPEVPCRVVEMTAQEVAAASSLQKDVRWKVVFPDLDATREAVAAIRTGTTIRVDSQAGVAPPRKTVLYVRNVDRQALGGLVLHRAQCSGRS